MKKTLWLVLVAFACVPSKKENNKEEFPVTEETPKVVMPTVSESMKVEGWKLLFDGKSLEGWRTFKGQKNISWEAKDGMLHCKAMNDRVQSEGNQLIDLITTEQYKDFELAFDWRITPDANSGVMYRVTEEFNEPFQSGPEYQILDDAGFPTQDPNHFTGAVFGMYVTAPKKMNPVGYWNSSKIIVNKNHVEHWLNGQKIVDYELNSTDWKKRKEAGSWKDVAGYGQSAQGHIDFQDRGSEVWFKNVMIKSL